MGFKDKSSRNRVLIVDDEPMVLESLVMLFEHYGWEVTAFESGDKLLKTRNLKDYQLAVVDQRMQGVSQGIDVIKYLKSGSSAPVFMLTGCVDPKLKREAKQVGADGYFDKPIRTSKLINALKRL